MKYKGLMVVFMSLLLAACGSDSDDKGEPTFLEGTWVGEECFDINSDLDHSNTILSFSGNSITITQPVYDSSDCSNEYKIAEYESKGSFIIGEEMVTASGETVTKLDIDLTTATATPYNEAGVTLLEDSYDCDGISWSAEESESIYDCKVQNDWSNEIKEIVYIENDVIRLGDSSLDLTDDGYPNHLDSVDEGFVKQ
jgi:hypothetical protein